MARLRGRCASSPKTGWRSSPPAAHELSRPLLLSAHHRQPGAGRRRGAAEAAGGPTQEAGRRGPVRSRRKSALPFLPAVIGVVTSPTGAVIRDILHRLRDRFPRHVLIWPVLVQGEGAEEQIAAAIAGFNAIAPGGRAAAARSADRGARRRQPGRPLGLQRGDRGACGRGQRHPADLRRGA